MSENIIEEAKVRLRDLPVSVISQGAEALVFLTDVHPYIKTPRLSNSQKFIIKYRPPKPYRHPQIDLAITKARTVSEVKFMNKLVRLDIPCPNLILTDYPNGIIWMEYIGYTLPNGQISSFKNWLWYHEEIGEDCASKEIQEMCLKVGELIGKLHLNDMIHGDLTSSNILLQNSTPFLIDFGLSSYSSMPEDKAVDLYVLERAITSTHSDFAEQYNSWLLQGYSLAHNKGIYKKFGPKRLAETLRKLDDVRQRGRKRSMLG